MPGRNGGSGGAGTSSALMRPPRRDTVPDLDTDPVGSPLTCGGRQRPCGAAKCPHCGGPGRYNVRPEESATTRAARILVEMLRQAEAPEALFLGALDERDRRRLAVAWGALVERVVSEIEVGRPLR